MRLERREKRHRRNAKVCVFCKPLPVQHAALLAAVGLVKEASAVEIPTFEYLHSYKEITYYYRTQVHMKYRVL